MLKQMLDILVCPFDKESSLELYELGTKNFEKTDSKIILESNMQDVKIEGGSVENKKDKTSKDPSDDDIIIEEGILFCNNCSRFYPIVEEIPIILPDELRDKNKDMEFITKWSNSLPEKVVKKALPWHL